MDGISRTVGAAATVLALALSAPGFAQSTPSATNEGDGAERQAEEETVPDITVTARKREESLQDAPLAVSAFTGQDLVERGLRDISEIALFTPGFSMQNIQSGTEQPFIRGQSTTSFERTLQTSSSFVDGNYFSVLGRTVFFPDVERVEIVRGPQAALFGRATFAGAINYVTKGPTERMGGEVRVLAGSYGRVNAHGSVSGPIVPDLLLFRVSANSEIFGGQYDNIPTERKTGRLSHQGLTGALRFTPSDHVTLDAKLFRTWYDDGGQVPEYIQGANTLNCFPNAAGVFTYFCGRLNPDPAQVSLNLDQVGDGRQKLVQTRALANLDWRLGEWGLTLVGTYAKQNSDTFCDCDYGNRAPLAGAFHSRFITTIENKSAELRVRSPATVPVRVLGGAYIFREESNSYNARAATITIPYVTVTTKAVFGSVELDLADRLTLSVDGRYQNERQTRSAIPGNPAINVEYNAFLPRGILEFKPSDDVLLYASAARGNQPGQFNTGTNIPADRVRVDSEQLWSYEVGAKTSFFDHRVRLNVAAYRIDWTNQVYRTEVTGTDGRIINILANLGRSRVNGVEAELAAVVARGLSVNATLAWTDAEYVNFISPNALRVYGVAQVAGRRLPNTPRTQGSFVATYRTPVSDEYDLFVRGDYAYRGRQYVSEVNQAYIGDLHLLHLGPGIESDRFRVALRVENLLDADVPEFATRFSDLNSPGLSRFGYLIKLRTGRTAELSFQYKF